ncbi:MAG: hypothetical protein JSW27_08170 [Phycisphaerales bacterium]|nr:MAG: hypothetical protein JSW27_08170 [Phycisphaerales bacterium]
MERAQKRYRRRVKCMGLVLLFLVHMVVRVPIRRAGGSAGLDVGFLPVVLIGGRAVYRSWPSVRAACILRNGELASLPPSAHVLKVKLWFTPMSGERHLRFSAPS